MGIAEVCTACSMFALFLGSSCPSPEPFPVPPLQAPSFTSATLTVARFDTYRPAVHLAWSSPHNDSLAVREFVILQRSQDSAGFSVLVRSIPDTVTGFYDNIDRFTFPQHWDFYTLEYRIFAIDSLGRAGDTSAIESLSVAWPPTLLWPATTDSVRPDSLAWTVFGVEFGYFSYVYLYSDTGGLIWKSPRPDTPTYSSHDNPDHYVQRLPGSLPLPSGQNYFWAVNVEIPTGQAWSIAVGRFYVR